MRNRLLLAAMAMALLAPSTFGTSPPPATPSATPGFLTYAAPESLAMADTAGEPSIGVNPLTGSAFFQSYTQTYRVRFDDTVTPPGVTWQDVSTGLHAVVNVDPILFTDTVTGRVFAGGLDGQCSVLGVSDDDGATWTPAGNACASPAFDHPTIGSGPWRAPVPVNALYSRAVYYCAQASVAQCAASGDGGLTFGPAVPVACGFINPGMHGSVMVGPEGNVYLPFKRCGSTNVNGISVSLNNGYTWTARPIPGAASAPGGFDPDIATTPSGWVWVGYPTAGYGAGVALSKNAGATWTNFGEIAAAAGVMSTTFHEMVAGDDGRAALVYLGSTTDGDPFDAAFTGTWDVYASYTFDAGGNWTTVKVTTDPVQRGWICASGTTCDTGRNLLDFIDATVDADGRVVIAFADGCLAACAGPAGTPAQSTGAWATIARQTCGPSLFAAVGHVNGGAACPAAPGAGPLSLSGALYATGLTPVHAADAPASGFVEAAGTSLTPTPPSGTTSKVALNGAGQAGANAGTIYDAHWFLPAPSRGLVIDDKDVTVHLWVTGTGGTVRVALYDAVANTFLPANQSLVSAEVTAPASTSPVQVSVTFADVSHVFARGLELYVDGPRQGDVQVHYDAVATPTRIEFA